jgi:predicted dithiol-disulfide oxidoreductase (DUF899 family)
MQDPKLVSQAAWFAAHQAHLAKENQFTTLRDELAEARRALPWLKLTQPYVFETEAGPKSLAELFGPRSQLIVYHFMFAPQSEHRCPGCSFLADHIDGANLHLKHHHVSVVVASRAPLAELLPFKRRMGWQFEWVSSGGSSFNYDMHVSFSDEQIARGEVVYNFEALNGGTPGQVPRDLPGASVFAKNEHGEVFLTFQTRARGGELLIGTYSYLDLTPKGRNETEPNPMKWVKLHDRYDNQG